MSRVTFIGAVADPFEHIASSDMMLLTSRDESFSLVALEAMACGLTVAAPAVGGLTELIDDGKDGLLFDRTDPKTAIRRIVDHLNDTQTKTKCSVAAASRAMAFCESRIVPQYEKLYQRAITEMQTPLV